MRITKIEIYRDGGTIQIEMEDDPEAGIYVLPTPFIGEPRLISYNGTALPIGSPQEAAFLSKLRNWWAAEITDEIRVGLDAFDRKIKNRVLLSDAHNFLYVRTVIDYLGKRNP